MSERESLQRGVKTDHGKTDEENEDGSDGPTPHHGYWSAIGEVVEDGRGYGRYDTPACVSWVWQGKTRKTCIMENATPNVSRPLNLRLSSGSYLHGSAFPHPHTHTRKERTHPSVSSLISSRVGPISFSSRIVYGAVLSCPCMCVSSQRHVGRPWATEGRL